MSFQFIYNMFKCSKQLARRARNHKPRSAYYCHPGFMNAINHVPIVFHSNSSTEHLRIDTGVKP